MYSPKIATPFFHNKIYLFCKRYTKSALDWSSSASLFDQKSDTDLLVSFPQNYQPHYEDTDVSRLLDISVVYVSEKEDETKLLPTSFSVFL